jgi:hypothetical protein
VKRIGLLALLFFIGLPSAAAFCEPGSRKAVSSPDPNVPSIIQAPAETPCDVASAPDIKPSEKWAYATPAASNLTPPDMDFTLPGHMDHQLSNPFHYVEYHPLRFANPADGVALVTEAPAKNSGLPFVLKKFDLKQRRVAGSWCDPSSSHVVDVSLDGKRAVLLGRSGSDRTMHGQDHIQVLDISVDPPKVIVSATPYSMEDKGKRDIDLVAMVDDDHLLTKNNDLRIVLWKLPEMKPVYIHHMVSPLCVEVTLSPDRRFFATEENDPKIPTISTRITFFDALTGEGRGAIPFYVPADPWHCYLVDHVFSPDGKMLLHRHAGGITLFSLDGAQPAKILDIGKPMGINDDDIGHVLFAAPGYLLINDRYLFDIEKQFIVWRYEKLDKTRYCPLGDRFIACTERQVVGQSGRELSLTFSTFQLPDAQTQATLAKLVPAQSYVVKPGDKVTIDVHLSDNPQVNQRIADDFKRQLQNNGMIVADNQPIKLEVSRQTFSPREVHYKGITTASSGTALVAATQTSVAFTIEGKVVWLNTRINGGAPGFLNVRSGESLDSAVTRQSPQTPAVDFILPKRVPAPRDPIGFGVTDMSGRMNRGGRKRTEKNGATTLPRPHLIAE